MILSLFFVETLNILIFNGFQRCPANIKEFNQPFSSPEGFFLACIVDKGIASSDVVSVEGLLGVDFILIMPPRIQAEVNNEDIFVLRMFIFHHFESLIILKSSSIKLVRQGQHIFLLTNCAELLFFFGPFDWIFLLDFFLFRICLHYKRIIMKIQKFIF